MKNYDEMRRLLKSGELREKGVDSGKRLSKIFFPGGTKKNVIWLQSKRAPVSDDFREMLQTSTIRISQNRFFFYTYM